MNVTLKSLRQLCVELAQEDRIMQSRLSPAKIMDLNRRKLCYFVMDSQGVVTAFAALWPTYRKDFYEFGTLWVHRDYRNKGISTTIFDRTMSCARKGSLLFLITKSPKVVHEAKKRKWDEVLYWQSSSNWQKACVPLGISSKESKRSFTADCRLFYTILD